jgi:neutral amino acid transport system permease protein
VTSRAGDRCANGAPVPGGGLPHAYDPPIVSGRRPHRWLLAFLLAALGATLLLTPPAHAQDDDAPAPGDPEASEEAEEAREQDAVSVVGALKYTDDEGEDVAVEGVQITATDADGEEVDVAATGEDGTWVLVLPGPGEYSFSLDTDTLPEGVSLRNEDRATTSFSMSPGQQRTLLFPLVEGEGGGARGVATRLDRLPQMLFLGLRFGLIIAMSAVGLSLIYGTTGLVNFAHGELVTLGALLAWLFNVTFGLHLFIAAPLAVGTAFFAGGAIDRGFWRPLRNRGTSLIAMLVVSIGVSLMIRYVYLYLFGGRTRPFAQYSIQTNTQELFGITFVPKDIWIIGVSVLLLVLVAIALQTTRIGKATRAVSDNKDLAESSGIDVERVILFVWATGAALAAVGGVFLGLTEQVNWQGGFQLLLLMFAGVTLGGLGTAYGALVGSIIVGVAVQVSTLFIAAELKNVAALLILVLILLVRPQGILGRKERVG